MCPPTYAYGYKTPSDRQSSSFISSSARDCRPPSRRQSSSFASSSRRSSRATYCAPPTNHIVDIFIPDQYLHHSTQPGTFTVDVFIPDTSTQQRMCPRPRFTMQSFRHDPAMDAPQDNGHGHRRRRSRRTESPPDPRPRPDFIRFMDAPQGNSIRFTFSQVGPYDRARIFTLPARVVEEIFPRVDALLNRRRFLYEGALLLDDFLAESLLRQTPPDALVGAYNSLFEHVLNPTRSLYRELEWNGNRRRSMDEIARQVMAVAQLLSSPRGLGCDGWLLEDFADACGRLFHHGLEDWSVDQRKWCFIYILEAFIDALTPNSRIGDEGSCVVLQGIWGGLGLETQRAVEEKINQEAIEDQELGRRLRITLDYLFARLDRARGRRRDARHWMGDFMGRGPDR